MQFMVSFSFTIFAKYIDDIWYINVEYSVYSGTLQYVNTTKIQCTGPRKREYHSDLRKLPTCIYSLFIVIIAKTWSTREWASALPNNRLKKSVSYKWSFFFFFLNCVLLVWWCQFKCLFNIQKKKKYYAFSVLFRGFEQINNITKTQPSPWPCKSSWKRNKQCTTYIGL